MVVIVRIFIHLIAQDVQTIDGHKLKVIRFPLFYLLNDGKGCIVQRPFFVVLHGTALHFHDKPVAHLVLAVQVIDAMPLGGSRR